jgi:GGDEF domain-containing protein
VSLPDDSENIQSQKTDKEIGIPGNYRFSVKKEGARFTILIPPLTGLPNRQLFRDRLDMVIASGLRREIKAALLL